MNAEIQEKAEFWMSDAFDENTKAEVKDLIENNPRELEDAFYKDLEFGTGGLRGIMGAGTNRVNSYTIAMATQGLANYIKKVSGNKNPGVAIAHDCRNNSHIFARKSAEVLAANDIKAYLFSELRSTPELSHAVRHLHCTAGIMITASHNPKEYNGYKVYWEDGGQIVPPNDSGIISEVRKIKTPKEINSNPKKELIAVIGEDVDNAYRKLTIKECRKPEIIKANSDMPIVFTPIHGTGISLVPILEQLGFENVSVVEEQKKPDGNFPTVHSPNPEEAAALDLALKLGKEKDAEIVMGTDPDGDRIGIAVKNEQGDLILLNGNQTAAMLTHYILSTLKADKKLPENGFVCKTIVTSELLDRISEKFNLPCYSTLTGFKYIAEKIRERDGKEKFICGGEESYGFLVGDSVRDKDANVTGALLCEIATWARSIGSSFYNELLNVYAEYGLYREALVSLVKKGKDGAKQINQIMQGYRDNTPAEISGSEVMEMRDYQKGEITDMRSGVKRKTGLPKSNVVQFYLADGSKVTARPSGTEPKIKFYFSLHAELNATADYERVSKQLDNRIDELKAAFVSS
ncbi:MAG: phospho-sugar mutase [Cryomorphaceae bacterium]|nr:phospho-sugar mutase [Flavobacteriales bacterium]